MFNFVSNGNVINNTGWYMFWVDEWDLLESLTDSLGNMGVK
jgi:hypothetical protein